MESIKPKHPPVRPLTGLSEGAHWPIDKEPFIRNIVAPVVKKEEGTVYTHPFLNTNKENDNGHY